MFLLFHILVKEEEPDRETEEDIGKEIPMEKTAENTAFIDYEKVKQKSLNTPSDWLR